MKPPDAATSTPDGLQLGQQSICDVTVQSRVG